MRSSACVAPALLMFAILTGADAFATVQPDIVFQDNFEAAPDCSSVGSAGCPGFAIVTPSAVISAGSTAGYCFYFRTPNASTFGSGRFSSTFGAATGHFIVYTTVGNLGAPVDAQPPGTFLGDCGYVTGKGTSNARWLYSAHAAVEQMRMPDDDGAGNPLAIELAANTAGFIEIYYENPTGDAIIAPPVRLVANAWPSGTTYTKTTSYETLNTGFSISSGSAGQATSSCAVPASVKFWRFTTQTHRYATAAEVSNSVTSQILVQTSNWESPAIAVFGAPSFYQFGASDKLATTCDYLNDSGGILVFGDNYSTAETCLGIGWFFPAAAPQICVNGVGPL